MTGAPRSTRTASTRTKMPVSVLVSSAVALFSLFLPAVSMSAFGVSDGANFFQLQGVFGAPLAVLFVAVIVLALLAGFLSAAWARKAAGIVGIVTSVFALYVVLKIVLAVIVGGSTSGMAGIVSVGFGTVVLGIAGITLLITAIGALRTKKQVKP